MNKPNILLLFSDQLRPFELGCYGHLVVQTPHIDRLAAMGVRFEHAITSNPVCTPARASLLSGQYGRTCTGMLGCCGEPVNHRTWFPDATLPELLRAQGYRTRLTGKWHIAPRPELVGFEEACYPLVNHRNRAQIFFDEQRHGEQINDFAPDYEVRQSCDFIRQAHDQPWFLFHNMCLPHMPYYDVPEHWLDMYDPEQLALRPNVVVDGRCYHDEEAFKIYLFDHLCTKLGLSEYLRLPASFNLHRLYAAYCGLVSCVDDQIGRMLGTLEESGQLENTIIVFSADHGENMGSHHLWNKISINDEALRIPYIVAHPGRINPAVIDDQVASLVDIAPTVLAMLGHAVPDCMQGSDLSAMLAGGIGRVRGGAAYAENLRGELAIRTPTHLYGVLTCTSADGPQRELRNDAFLFNDLRDDQYQLRNLAATGEQLELAEELKTRLLAWDHATSWLPGSLGGVYGQGPQHDPPPPALGYRQ